MRIERLDLTRYGRFTDQTLDFGPARPGEPDLHIVLGPNEAGKTTTLNAWLDLLYGMGLTTPYAYLHGYDLMRVGARLALPDGARDYVRVKRNKGSLLDADGNPVADDTLSHALGGLSRAAYANMFSLDAEALESGGKDAIASKGHLGEMLFSASAGLGALSGRLGELRERADAFWKPRSRKSELAQLKGELLALRQQRDAIDTIASRHAALNADLQRSLASYQEASALRATLTTRAGTIRGLLEAMALAPRLAALRDDLAQIPDLPAAPAEWTKRAAELLVAEAEAQARLQTLRGVEGDLTQRLAAIPEDDGASELGPQLQQLEMLHSRNDTATLDIPKLQHDLELGERQLADLLRQLGRDNETEPASLLLPVHLADSLRALIDRRAVIDTQLQDARREHAEAESALEALEASAPQHDDIGNTLPEEQVARLGALADSALQEGFDRRIAAAARALASATDLLDLRMQQLAPWTGDSGALAALTAPAASELQTLQRELAEAARQHDALSQAMAGIAAEQQQLAAELAGLAHFTRDADETGAAQARAQREQAWAAHRSALSSATADVFEAAMRRDDMVAETRLTRQGELLREAQLRQELARRHHQHDQTQARIEAAAARMAALRQQTRDLATSVSPQLASLEAPDALESWLKRRDHALEAREPMLIREQELAEACARRDETIGELRRLLPQAAAVRADLPELVAAAQQLRHAASAWRQRQDERGRAASNRDNRQRALQRVQAADTGWRTEWASACATCWLGNEPEAPSCGRVRAALDILARLEAVLTHRHERAARIAAMERDQRQFRDALASLAPLPGPGEAETLKKSASALFQQLQARAAAASENRRRRIELEAERDKTRNELQRTQQGLRQLAAEVAQMAAHFRVETLPEIRNALAASEKRQTWMAQVRELEQRILGHTAAASMNDADRQLADTDRNALTSELAAIDAELQNANTRLEELFAQRREAEKAIAAIGADASVALIDSQRQTILLEIEDKTRSWLKLRFGIAATERALAIWRDSHRSSLLKHASEAFSHISNGAWAGLAAQPGAAGEMLVALDSNRVPKEVEKLSKGARFQLYLALRIAAYQDFADDRMPPPFVADDIMETFDDDRAGATFELLGGMARKGQVIYLTHHRHLCEIAARHCPGARLHELAP